MIGPMQIAEVIDEISRYAGIPQEAATAGVEREVAALGTNVRAAVKEFSVTPHRYDTHLERLYRESPSFIFETMVFWNLPYRRQWIEEARARIGLMCARAGKKEAEARILLLGDGSGSDSLFLAGHGLCVDYFDIPGSRTFDFAVSRFRGHGVYDSSVRVVTDEETLAGRRGMYDAVVCFEVLEHHPHPITLIGQIGSLLREGGLALVTEAFGRVNDSLPTHLASNLRYEGLTPFLFLRENMVLTWYGRNPVFHPCEFVKVRQPSFRQRAGVYGNRDVVRAFLAARKRQLFRNFGNPRTRGEVA